jgi:heme/copper-type cytochrome/quinol oxidase subunit 2
MTAKTVSTLPTAIAIAAIAILAAVAAPSITHAADDSTQLRFQAGNVVPASLTLPANTPVKLQVTNAGADAVEFESFELHRERVVQPGQTITVYIPALAPGVYPFFDDFSHGAVKGEIVSR